MNLKKIILSANTKFENKFNDLSKISANMLILGQLFIVLILSASLFYAACLNPDSRIFLDIFNSVHILFENAASGLFILWIAAIFLDYIDKKQ
ncbi:MAG: hypothetical protein FWF92_01205 [Oscillospiraceae bacterium]|nr:hypothetical protein [Oscillospiraceae bacterium]